MLLNTHPALIELHLAQTRKWLPATVTPFSSHPQRKRTQMLTDRGTTPDCGRKTSGKRCRRLEAGRLKLGRPVPSRRSANPAFVCQRLFHAVMNNVIVPAADTKRLSTTRLQTFRTKRCSTIGALGDRITAAKHVIGGITASELNLATKIHKVLHAALDLA